MITSFTIGLKRYNVRDIKVKDLYYILDTEKYGDREGALHIVSHLSGCPKEDLNKLKPFQFNPLWGMITDKIKMVEAPLHTEIKLNGTHYGFIKLDEITVGELADLELLKVAGNKENNTHKILSILYRPITGYIGNKYTIEEYDGTKTLERSDDFLELDLDIMNGAIFFFITFIQTFTNRMSGLLVEELRTIQADTTQKPNKEFSLFGRTYSIPWQKMTRSKSVKPLNVG